MTQLPASCFCFVVTGLIERRHLRITLYGHSFVYWAAKFAIKSGRGRDLGLGEWADLVWKGRRGMRWNAFLPMALSEPQDPAPSIVVIHLGGNDLSRMSGKSLILKVIDDLRVFRTRRPDIRIIWSAIIPRLVWGAHHHPQKMHKARKAPR